MKELMEKMQELVKGQDDLMRGQRKLEELEERLLKVRLAASRVDSLSRSGRYATGNSNGIGKLNLTIPRFRVDCE